MSALNNALAKAQQSIPECVATGYVDMSTGMLLGVKTVDSHPQEVLDLVAAATADLFQGASVSTRSFSASRAGSPRTARTTSRRSSSSARTSCTCSCGVSAFRSRPSSSSVARPPTSEWFWRRAAWRSATSKPRSEREPRNGDRSPSRWSASTADAGGHPLERRARPIGDVGNHANPTFGRARHLHRSWLWGPARSMQAESAKSRRPHGAHRHCRTCRPTRPRAQHPRAMPSRTAAKAPRAVVP